MTSVCRCMQRTPCWLCDVTVLPLAHLPPRSGGCAGAPPRGIPAGAGSKSWFAGNPACGTGPARGKRTVICLPAAKCPMPWCVNQACRQRAGLHPFCRTVAAPRTPSLPKLLGPLQTELAAAEAAIPARPAAPPPAARVAKLRERLARVSRQAGELEVSLGGRRRTCVRPWLLPEPAVHMPARPDRSFKIWCV